MKHKRHADIWVLGDLRNKRLFGASLNIMSKAREVAGSFSEKVVMVLLGSTSDAEPDGSTGLRAGLSIDLAAEESIAHGADFVYIFENETLLLTRADSYSVILADNVQKYAPRLVMFALTDFGRELAARTARISNAGLIADCIDLREEGRGIVATCPSWGGEILADISFTDGSRTGFVTLQPYAFQAAEVQGDPGVIERIRVEGIQAHGGLTLLSSSSELAEKQPLENAKVVVVGGAGLGKMEDFGLVRDLAVATGGEVGSTRPPVLQHWVEADRLIGQTGKAVRPELLFSVGTSGALQYTAGILEAKTIVAVNRDQNAPIFQIADLGIVGDAKRLLPLLTAKIKQVTMRKLADVLQEKEKNPADSGFGTQVRKLRESHNWSLEALAEATGQSPEFIEKVEIGEISPPVSFLLRLSSALGVDPGTFLRKEERILIRNMRAQALVKRTQNYSYQTLSPGAENDRLRAFMVTIEPKQTHKPVAYKHEGEEFIFVMEGDLGLTLDNKMHHLKSGDSIHFNSDVPHKLKSISNDATRCIVVLYTP